MFDRLKRLRGRSAHELGVRLRQYACARAELAAQLTGFPHSVTLGVLHGIPAFPLITVGGAAFHSDDSLRRMAAGDLEAVAAANSRASNAHAGRVDLLGYTDLHIGDPPDWHRDPVGGARAPRVHWSRVPYLDTRVVGDHKALWEPNRCQYLYAPAMRWLLHQRHEDFELIQRHLNSWLDENPFRTGVNWASSLEVAYRAITWCWLLRLLAKAPWSVSTIDRLSRSLAQHALHVERYLSTYFSPNTHLTGEALGLFYVGTVLPHVKQSTRWRTLGARVLENALERQVRNDGTYFEQATQYHRYTTEIYLHYVRLAESSGYPLGPRVRSKLAGLFEVLRSIADGRGRIPLIGDDDGGLLLPLDHRPPDDVRGLLLAGAVTLGRPDLAPSGAPPIMAAALCGYEATDRVLSGGNGTPLWTDRAFPDGGLLVLRDGWRPADAVAVLDAGAHGALNCGHAHSDALALTLSLGERPLFIDRGTFTYSGDRRNEFRSTGSHNTVEIDELSSATPGTPFAWESIPPDPRHAWGGAGPVRWLRATARGHLDSGRPSRHSRIVLHVDGGPWVVVDQVARDGGFRTAQGRWYLHPDCEPVQAGERAYEILIAGSVERAARVDILSAATCSVENRDVSLRLGDLRPSRILVSGAGSPGAIVTVVTPPIDAPPMRCAAEGGPSLWTWRDALNMHEIRLPATTEGSWNAFGFSTDAVVAWRICGSDRGADGRPSEWIVLAGGHEATSAVGDRFALPGDPDLPAVLVLERTAAGWRGSADD
jgi:hypothetical protein